MPESGIAVGHGVDSGFVPEGERKLVTALFVDIINSTGLGQDLDPEEATASSLCSARRLLTKIIRSVRSMQLCGFRTRSGA